MSAVAFAHPGKTRWSATLSPIPHNMVADHGSNVTGTAKLTVDGTRVHVNIHVRGLTPNLPHAMHIHGQLDQANVCPPATADTSHDGLISLEEGAPFYGPINVSFTRTGDTTAASGLAPERFPIADSEGNLNNNRTFTIPQNVLNRLGSLHIVCTDWPATGTPLVLSAATTRCSRLYSRSPAAASQASKTTFPSDYRLGFRNWRPDEIAVSATRHAGSRYVVRARSSRFLDCWSSRANASRRHRSLLDRSRPAWARFSSLGQLGGAVWPVFGARGILGDDVPSIFRKDANA